MKTFRDAPPAFGRKDWPTALAVTSMGVIVLGLTSALFRGHMSLHAGMFFATVLGNAGVAWLAMKASKLQIPYGDVSARHVGVVVAGAMALALSAAGLTGMMAEMIQAAAQGTAMESFLAEMAVQREDAYEKILLLGHARYIPIVLITVAIAPGVCEEFFFRGALYEYVRGFSPTARILFIGSVFAAIHFDVYGFLPLLVAGSVFTWLRYVTGGWVVPAIGHISFNAFNGVILPRVADTDEPSRLFLGVSFLGAGLLAWVIFQWLPQRLDPDA